MNITSVDNSNNGLFRPLHIMTSPPSYRVFCHLLGASGLLHGVTVLTIVQRVPVAIPTRPAPTPWIVLLGQPPEYPYFFPHTFNRPIPYSLPNPFFLSQSASLACVRATFTLHALSYYRKMMSWYLQNYCIVLLAGIRNCCGLERNLERIPKQYAVIAQEAA
jgi:hypothetical protein